jgi:hypothetical protein
VLCAYPAAVTEKTESLETAILDFASLRRVGKRQLLRDLSKVVNDDWENTAAMLAYIGEIDRRNLYLEDAYSSMFMMCTKHFGMSEAIAAKRIRAGRAAGRFPLILAMIRRGELHLSGVHQLAGHLTEKNHEEVLQRAKHRSMREIEMLIAEISPQPDRESVLRELVVEPEDGIDPGQGVMGRTLESGRVPANSL